MPPRTAAKPKKSLKTSEKPSRRAASPLPSAKQSSVIKQRAKASLHDWYLEDQSDQTGWRLIIVGHSAPKTSGEQTEVQKFTTNTISERASPKAIYTRSGSLYRLVGDLNGEKTSANGFGPIVVQQFLRGFPVDWMKILREDWKRRYGKRDDAVPDEDWTHDGEDEPVEPKTTHSVLKQSSVKASETSRLLVLRGGKPIPLNLAAVDGDLNEERLESVDLNFAAGHLPNSHRLTAVALNYASEVPACVSKLDNTDTTKSSSFKCHSDGDRAAQNIPDRLATFLKGSGRVSGSRLPVSGLLKSYTVGADSTALTGTPVAETVDFPTCRSPVSYDDSEVYSDQKIDVIRSSATRDPRKVSIGKGLDPPISIDEGLFKAPSVLQPSESTVRSGFLRPPRISPHRATLKKRTAKWFAETIGQVVGVPSSDSKRTNYANLLFKKKTSQEQSEELLPAFDWNSETDKAVQPVQPIAFRDTTKTFRMSFGYNPKNKRRRRSTLLDASSAAAAANRLNFAGFLANDKRKLQRSKKVTDLTSKNGLVDCAGISVPAFPEFVENDQENEPWSDDGEDTSVMTTGSDV